MHFCTLTFADHPDRALDNFNVKLRKGVPRSLFLERNFGHPGQKEFVCSFPEVKTTTKNLFDIGKNRVVGTRIWVA